MHEDPGTAPRGVLFALDDAGRELPDPYAATSAATNPAGWTWLHLAQVSDDARTWLMDGSGIPMHAARAMVADRTRPRCVPIGRGVLFIGRGVNLDPTSTPEDMVTIRAWVEPERLVTMVVRRLRSAETVARQLGSGPSSGPSPDSSPGPESGSAPCSPGDALARLISEMVDRIAPVVEDLGETLDEIQSYVIDDSTPNINASTLSPLRLRTVSLHRYLVPMHDAATSLIEAGTVELPDESRIELITTRDRLARMTEELASIDARAGVTRDEVVSRRAEELNDRVYALTIIAGVFLPLSVITGALGMNVGGVPLTDHPQGFWIMSIGMFVLLVSTLAVLRLKRWI